MPETTQALSPDELLARTIHCSVCNAPPTIPCQRICWRKDSEGWEAGLETRTIAHAHRLKEAKRLRMVKERLNGQA